MNVQRTRLRSHITLLCLALLASAPMNAQAPAPAIQMAPGIVVSAPEQPPMAWVADAQGRVAAINLENGSVRWRGPAEGLPLVLFDQQLVVLGRPDRAGRLSLQRVDPDTGAIRGGVLGDLPAGVLASPDPQPNRIFLATADSSAGGLRISWSYADWPLRGALLPQAPGSGRERRELSGVVSVDFATNLVRSMTNAAILAPRTPDLIGAERVDSLVGIQFRAADDLAVQVSTAVADEVLGTQWRWSLHERASGRALGSLLLPYSSAPFLLRGSQLLWRSEPLTRLQSSGSYEQLPARLVAQALDSGRELWSIELLDRHYRGVLPP